MTDASKSHDLQEQLKRAHARIVELEADVESEGIRVGTLIDVLKERDDEIRALKGQLNLLRVDRRYEVSA